MDGDTITLAFTDGWPTVRLMTYTAGGGSSRQEIRARPFDCRACFEAGRGMVDHMDGSACVVPLTAGGAF